MIVKCYGRMEGDAFTVMDVACIGIKGMKVRCTSINPRRCRDG